jgi:hypothetical protein
VSETSTAIIGPRAVTWTLTTAQHDDSHNSTASEHATAIVLAHHATDTGDQ